MNMLTHNIAPSGKYNLQVFSIQISRNFLKKEQITNLPLLKASHPHQSTKSPIAQLTGVPRGSDEFPLSYLPNLGPSIIAEANAV